MLGVGVPASGLPSHECENRAVFTSPEETRRRPKSIAQRMSALNRNKEVTLKVKIAISCHTQNIDKHRDNSGGMACAQVVGEQRVHPCESAIMPGHAPRQMAMPQGREAQKACAAAGENNAEPQRQTHQAMRQGVREAHRQRAFGIMSSRNFDNEQRAGRINSTRVRRTESSGKYPAPREMYSK